VILFIIVVDCFVSGWTDHLWGQLPFEIVLVVASFALEGLLLLVFFITLWRTFLMRSGLLELACYAFRNPLMLVVLRGALLAAHRVFRLLYGLGVLCKDPVDECYKAYWETPIATYVRPLLLVVTVLHHVVFLRATFGLSQIRHHIAPQ
jgi:hypothetical protein